MKITWKGAESIVVGRTIEQPTQDVVKNTMSLWQADLDTAVRYGGELTRAALGAMDIRGDKRYVLVDTKIHMLMPGQCPAIPGWHTDGAPRGIRGDSLRVERFSPIGDGPPDLEVQQRWERAGDTPRFHLLVTGVGCLTDFLSKPITMEVPVVPTSDLYGIITHKMRTNEYERETYTDDSIMWESPSCTALEWGWWHLHAAKLATTREFRYLIRVTESDYHQPQTDLSKIIRTQNTVYSPMEFGW